MSRIAIGLAVVAAAGTLCLTVRAQQATGTGRIAGVVTTSDLPPVAVRHAIVTLGGSGANGRSAITDDQGNFAIDQVPVGWFSVTAARPGYLTNAYGASAPGRPGVLVPVSSGQSVSGLTVKLPRGAAITGTVRDRTGEPAANVAVAVMRVVEDSSVMQVTQSSDTVVSDDRGIYRAFGLMPGNYVVAAFPRMPSLGEMAVRSSAEIDALMAEQQRASRGTRQAAAPTTSTTPAATPVAPPILATKPQSYLYVPIYYPGTPSAADGSRVSVRAGEERAGIDITLEPVPIGEIDGVATAAGTVPELTMTIASNSPPLPGVFGMSPSVSGRPGSRSDPSFKIVSVPPGRYTITAKTANFRTVYTTDGFYTQTVDAGTVPLLWGAIEVDVGPGGLHGVALPLQPALSFSGRIAFDATALKPPADLTAVRISLSAKPTTPSGQPTAGANLTGSALVRADGSFEVTGLLPGRYAVTASMPGSSGPAGWWLASVDVKGKDALDTLLDIGAAGNVSGSVLTFSDRHAALEGTLRSSRQQASEYYVIVFPTDKTLWRSGARRVKATRPAADGHFALPDLPPGDYILAAIADVTTDEWQNPSFLDQLSNAGLKITIAPGEKKLQNLQVK